MSSREQDWKRLIGRALQSGHAPLPADFARSVAQLVAARRTRRERMERAVLGLGFVALLFVCGWGAGRWVGPGWLEMNPERWLAGLGSGAGWPLVAAAAIGLVRALSFKRRLVAVT